MQSPLIPLLLGLALIGGAVGIHRQQKAIQRADVRDIAGLRAELDSVRAAVARATAGPGSVLTLVGVLLIGLAAVTQREQGRQPSGADRLS